MEQSGQIPTPMQPIAPDAHGAHSLTSFVRRISGLHPLRVFLGRPAEGFVERAMVASLVPLRYLIVHLRTSAWSRRGIRVSVCLLSMGLHRVIRRAAQAQRSV